MSAQERLHHESVQALLGLQLVLHHKTLQEQFSNQVVALDPALWVSSTLLLLQCVCVANLLRVHVSAALGSPWLQRLRNTGGMRCLHNRSRLDWRSIHSSSADFHPVKCTCAVHVSSCSSIALWCQQSPPSQAKGLFASPLPCTNCLPGLVPPSLGSHAPPSNAHCRPRQPLQHARPDAPTPPCVR